MLTWSTESGNAVSIEPDDEIHNPQLSSQASVHPKATTMYRLTARSSTGQTTTWDRTVAVDKPAVVDFSATAQSVVQSGSVLLKWNVAGASSPSLTSPDGVVHQVATGQTEFQVQPTMASDNDYTLTATNSSGSHSKKITVALRPSQKLSFKAEPDTIALGEITTLNWQVDAPASSVVALEPDDSGARLRLEDTRTRRPGHKRWTTPWA